MKIIELVIKIPEEIYQEIKETNMVISGRRSGKRLACILFNAINTGTRLPEGHGRLIDADKLELDDGYSNYDGYYHKFSQSQIQHAPTVLEADEKKQRNNVEFVCDIFDEMNRDDQIKVWQYVNEIMEGE